jgi:hypothetical protein
MKALLERARELVTNRWSPVVGVAVLALVLVCKLDAGRRAADRAAQLAEAEELRQAGLVVAAERDARGMRAALGAAVKTSEDLAAELERVKRAAKGARPSVVFSGSTGPVVAGGAPRPNPGQEAPPTQGQDHPQAGAADREGASCPVSPACLLAAGDQGEVRVDEVILETKAGNVVLAGAASCWRLEPAPAARLFGGPLRGSLSVAKPRPEAGWGAGVWTGVGREGWAAGPALALPPARLWRLQVEAVVGGGLGPSGAWQGGASAVGRWR